ncbi:MAG: hypothetical protein ICV53_16315 [Flavisolibacter sp.]|nr:hypothetical protein [Flavisolibacter sp.]MBD0349882.1 hypothetical protein [Flavisolibacter sp.]MBD0367651.1 hypothetical protein [Flavisolibacter sp.]
MEQEVMKTVLQEILQELNNQREQLSLLQKDLEAVSKTSMRMEGKLSQPDAVPVLLSGGQMVLLKELLKENLEGLRQEMMEHPAVCNTHKHFSLFPLTFRMEHFPLLVNTIMKWVVVLMVLLFTMWLVAGLRK